MFRRNKLRALCVVATVCLLSLLCYLLGSDEETGTYSLRSMSWYTPTRQKDPHALQPRLVWQYGETHHPYFLSPVLQFQNDALRMRTMFNLTGLNSQSVLQATKKLIVFYNMPVWHKMETRYKHSLQNCPVRSCTLSDDKTLLSRADAVIFYVLDIPRDRTPPPKPVNQSWIFFAHEPPWDFPQWNNLFNWTMTFRFDSDIVCPYFALLPKPQPDVRNFISITRRKSSPVMWLVSHCGARSRRDEYVQELQKYIQVDVYGGCGSFKCSRSGKNSCDHIQNDKYKFYLAFENSLCRGYITEKLFRCYTLDIIPVVRGGARYSELLPERTYINTADFPSAKHLAEYLIYLDNNNTAYAEMLQKKSQFRITDPKSTLDSSLCDICIKLQDIDRFGNAYTDINKWWNTDTCQEASDLCNCTTQENHTSLTKLKTLS